MGVLSETRERILGLCRDAGVDFAMPVTVTWPTAAEGPVRKGREHLVEAVVDGAVGQAWTDQPSEWSGTLGDVLQMPLKAASRRAIVVATLNALSGRLGLTGHNLRCRRGESVACGRELVAQLKRRFEDSARILLVGYQPGLAEALVKAFGPKSVRVLDHDADNIGRTLHGVRIENGDADYSGDVRWCDLMVVTGSSVVNGTLDDLLRHSQDASKPLVFFGNTIAAVAAIADLQRLCPAAAH